MSRKRQTLDGLWGDCCTLLPAVRNLVERAYMAKTAKPSEKHYQIIWMPDLPIGPPEMTFIHDCTKLPIKQLGRTSAPPRSDGTMDVKGELFVMSESPYAAHNVYCATCHNCKVVFFVSAWDKNDTMENYVKGLKAGKRRR
jgi:hypothetical protein